MVPCRLADLPRLILTRAQPVDVCFVLGSPPDRDGNVNLGPTVAVTHELLAVARAAVLEINANVPVVRGDTTVPLGRFDAVIASDGPLVEAAVPRGDPSPAVARIGEQIAGLIPHGSTLQVGIGAIPSALPRYLRHHRHLGIHSGLITDGVADLIRLGVADGTAKETDRGMAIAGELSGSAALYRFAAAHRPGQRREPGGHPRRRGGRSGRLRAGRGHLG